jgi:hypothetical protein
MTINNNNIFGAFTLGEVRSGRLTGDWLHTDTVANYGWFGGGFFSPPFAVFSTVDRIDFSNDTGTASIRGPLSVPKSGSAATGNSNYGWFGAGGIFTPPASSDTISTVDRIDFSNDLAAISVRGPLNQKGSDLAATGNSNYGWFSGSSVPSPAAAKIDRIDFSNDSATALVRVPLSSPNGKASSAATGNSNYGWFGGGRTNTNPSLSSVERIDFSNDTVLASVRNPLSVVRDYLSATGNSNYGWFGGGRTFPGIFHSVVDRIDFSNDTSTVSVRGLLTSTRYGAGATGNSNSGWFGGGNDGAAYLAAVNRIDFSNDSVQASSRGSLSSARTLLSATSGVLNIRRQKAGNYGWFGGGTNPSAPTVKSIVDRIDFSNDSVSASPRGLLSSIRYIHAATGNSNFGWFGGGSPGPAATKVATVDRIDFSNDSSTASPRGPLSSARSGLSATGNSNYGWFGGGTVSGPGVATVDRIDFSNDSATASPRGPLSSLRGSGAATGNSNYGWWGAGFAPSISTVERIDFSNDSAGGSFRCILNLGGSLVSQLTATSNSNYGWFGGGLVSAATSAINRIDFSNDSATISVRGPLSATKNALAATGNSNYGWFGGGQFVSAIATVDRIDFSNDLSAVSPRGSLSSPRQSLAATSNTSR